MEVKPFPFIIPFHPQYLPRHAPLILQGVGIQGGGIRWPKTLIFSLLTVSPNKVVSRKKSVRVYLSCYIKGPFPLFRIWAVHPCQYQISAPPGELKEIPTSLESFRKNMKCLEFKK